MLKDKTAIITGSATGIGEGVARLFSEQGAKLILLDLKEETHGLPHTRAFACDVSDSEQVARVLAEAGPADILINNAGIYPRRPFLETTEAEWDHMQAVNLKSMFLTTRAVLPGMVERSYGKVVNISSVTFHLGLANLCHYVASKGGVMGLTRSLAREFGPCGVYVNCITPGAILVEAEKAVQTEEALREIVSQQSLKRRLVPEDVARVCLFLASDLSDGLTGQTINVDAGWIMH
jgi:3-oxoacyl-[acyl-carrier protein] reductase